MYSNTSFFPCAETHFECRFEKGRVINTCAPGKKESRALTVEYDVTNVQGSVCVEDDVSCEPRIVEN